MPVGTRGAVRLLDAGGSGRARPAGRAGQHLPPDAPARGRGGRGPGGPPPLHRLERPPADRLRGLPGVFPRSPGRRRRRDLPLDLRRLAPPADPGDSRWPIQERLGADIQMALDICCGLPAPEEEVRLAAEAHPGLGDPGPRRPPTRADQCLFGIVQGGVSHRPPGGARRADSGPGLRRLRHRRAVRRRAPGGDAAGAGRGPGRAAGRPAPLPDGCRRPGHAARRPWHWGWTCSTASCPPGWPATAPP